MMNSRVAMLFVLGSAALLLLPSVSAGRLQHNCKRCPVDLLQSPAACNMSNSDVRCTTFTPCYAATAELMNGTLVSVRGCYTWQGDCSNITACEQVGNQTGTAFKQCIAECCNTDRCNEMVPALMPLPIPSSSPSPSVPVTSSTGGTTTGTEATQPAPTSSAMKFGARYLLVFLPAVIFMLN